MSELFAKLAQEWAVIQGAPISFFMAWLLAATISFLILKWSLGAVITRKSAEIGLLERQVGDYRDKLQGRSPDEARAKIDALEAEIQRLTGWRWPPLPPPTIEAVKTRLRGITPAGVSLFVEDRDGRALAQSFEQIFKEVEWPLTRERSMMPLPDGISIATARGVQGRVLKEAIEATSGLEVALHTGEDYPDDIQLLIGIRPEKHHAPRP